jgi:hypothetical protein
MALEHYPCILQLQWVGLNSQACFLWYWILPLSNTESPRFEIYLYGLMVASHIRGPYFHSRHQETPLAGRWASSGSPLPGSEAASPSVGIVTSMIRAFGSLTIGLVGPPWVKVIWDPRYVNKPIPSMRIGLSGRYRNS